MNQPPYGLRFLKKSIAIFQGFFGAGAKERDSLNGNKPVDPGVAGFVNHTHGAPSQFGDKFVTAQAFAPTCFHGPYSRLIRKSGSAHQGELKSAYILRLYGKTAVKAAVAGVTAVIKSDLFNLKFRSSLRYFMYFPRLTRRLPAANPV